MKRSNSWGSKANRDRRRELANTNAEKEQVKCLTCTRRHRRGRACVQPSGPVVLGV